ncbi:N-acetyltransferase family protein [Rhizobium bangladeshense]|uniref:N-acetyltransferase family protein n=1 Tax=Rhizobium bangladeshense TaxID=1138189 RepID=A0ABS7LP32_9HYPH|nr:GNAT family N-acetyltransferase [Rhizobium bangladeshense]MBX4869013.1 N-acetyltransferase [Rhizobium bangladeshense]MBX4873149.1 N-acetyltransferase [Rhizobium bangladeshense]MBX4884527.1 N-acetyltransferase [Rhizobium bangladeshense]MBY3593226.1 N-acetyltransferase family protein [Rhizobium bangladeshense]
MSFLLRDASQADISAIAGIYREAVLNGVASYEIAPPSEVEMAQRFSAIVSQHYPYIAAVNGDGILLGYAYASAFRTRPAYRWLVEDSIYLAPKARGRGIGKALLTELIERCTVLGFRQMAAVIGGASPASIALHRGAGFDEVGLMRGTGYKHGRWLDTMFMQRALGEGMTTNPDAAAYPGTLFAG